MLFLASDMALVHSFALLGTNISPEKAILKMIFPFHRLELGYVIISWRVLTSEKRSNQPAIITTRTSPLSLRFQCPKTLSSRSSNTPQKMKRLVKPPPKKSLEHLKVGGCHLNQTSIFGKFHPFMTSRV